MSPAPYANRVYRGDCVRVLPSLPDASVDLVVTDPPYLIRYESREGKRVLNDDNDRWLFPAFREVGRVLKPGRFCVSFYGWSQADRFLAAWRAAGLTPVGHFVWLKRYASSRRLAECKHEVAYLLVRGWPRTPNRIIPDTLPWEYTGNRLHPTQKPVSAIAPLIEAYSRPGDIVLDPFMGSGSTLVAARALKRQVIGVELSPAHYETAVARLRGPRELVPVAA